MKKMTKRLACLTYADADGALHTVYSAVLRYTY